MSGVSHVFHPETYWLNTVITTFAENLALNKNTWESTTPYTHVPPSNAVDGNKLLDPLDCSRTSTEAWPTWRVDLGDIYRVAYFNITNRESMLITE